MLVSGMVLAFLGVGAVASSDGASAHTPSAGATCEAANTNLVNYQVKPGSPEIPGALITAEVPAWDETTNPGQPYIAPTPDQPATYGPTEYLWKSWNWDTLEYDYRWSVSAPGDWWFKVWPAQSRPGPELTPFIAGNPGQPFIEPTVVHHDAIPAVYGPVTPAVPADSTPNNVVVTIDGVVQDNVDFGSTFAKSYTFSSQFVAHAWSVVVTAWDDPSGTNGWTKTYSGVSTPCYDNSLRPSLSASSQCGSWTGEFNNPTKYGWVFDYQVDNEAASGPGWGTGPVYQTVYIPAFGGTQTRTVTFPEDSGKHTVMYRLNVGPEQDWYIPAVTVDIETNCASDLVTPVAPTFTPPTCVASGTLVGIDTDQYIWIRSGPDSAAMLQAVATGSTNLTGQTAYGPYDLTQLTGEQCAPPPTSVTPVTPTVTHEIKVCTATNYTVATTSGTATIAVTTGGRYLLDGKVVSGTINLAPGTYIPTFEVVSNKYVRSDTVVDLTIVIKAGVAPSCVKPPTVGPKVVTDYVSDSANGFNPLAWLGLVAGLTLVGFGLKRSPFLTKARQR